MSPVGNRCWRSIGVLFVPIVENTTFVCRLLPQHTPGFEIQAKYLESLQPICANAVLVIEFLAARIGMFDCLEARMHRAFDRRCQKYSLTPDNRRGVTPTRNRCFPLN